MAAPPKSPVCLVRGSINCDEYYQVNAIVRPGETISSTGFTRRVGGKGANQAVAVARSMWKENGMPSSTVQLVGNVGNDLYGNWLRTEMEKSGVDARQLKAVEIPTGRAIIQVAQDGENSIVLFPGSNFSTQHEDAWVASGTSYLTSDVSHLLIQNEIAMRSTMFLLQNLPPGVVTVFNPSPMPSSPELRALPWSKITWLVVNQGEAVQLCNAFNVDSLPVALGHDSESQDSTLASLHILNTLSDIPALKDTGIVMTLGSKGLIASPFKDCDPLVLPCKDLHGERVVDTTGAGDCFTGYFVGGLMGAWTDDEHGRRGTIDRGSLMRVLDFASQAAGMSVLKEGTIDSYPMRWQVDTELGSSS